MACNVPVIKGSACPACKQPLVDPGIVPPGDCRPAFDHDLDRLRSTVDTTFGPGTGEYLFPPGTLVLLNKVGAIDLDYQVIANGAWCGNLRYDIVRHAHAFLPALPGARLLYKFHATRGTLDGPELPPGFIEYDANAESFAAAGKDVLVPGILRMNDHFQQGDPCIVFSRNGVIAAGYHAIAAPVAAGMRREGKGRVAKLKHHGPPVEEKAIPDPRSFPPSSWDKAIDVNGPLLDAIEGDAVSFIRKIAAKFNLPVATAYSGGKDSLVTLLLVIKALGDSPRGKDHHVFFADTGLEFPEVIKNVHEVAQWAGLGDRYLERAIGDKFWSLVEGFGPPAVDFRFCCHALKASQINDMIEAIGSEHPREDGSPSKVLVFLGQRRYESFKRAEERRVYTNSYVPMQIVATPIKNWTALEEWLYLLRERSKDPRLPINPLYFKGHDRIGCYLCPAQPVASLEQVKETHPALHARWMAELGRHARARGYPPEWIDWGLWRFKIPRGPHALLSKQVMGNARASLPATGAITPADLLLHVEKGASPCTSGGFSIKARMSVPLVLPDILPWVKTLDKRAEVDEDAGIIFMEGEDVRFVVFADGSVFLQAPDPAFDLDGYLALLFGVLARAVACQRCGVCMDVCPAGVLQQDATGAIIIDPAGCNGVACQRCTTLCPVFHAVQKQGRRGP